MRTLILAVFLALNLPIQAVAEGFSPKQTEAIRKIVKDYLMENPEAIVDAIEAMQEKERVKADKEAEKTMKDRKTDIFSDPNTPVAGNPNGDVTIVEFFDYRCGYCKNVYPPMMQVIKDDGKVKLVLKELPVLGPESMLASKMALATRAQNKYIEFHDALMRHRGGLNEAVLLKLAGDLGLDIAKLRKDMEDPAVEKQLLANADLAMNLNIRGTPGFVIGHQLVPGAVDAKTFQQLIAEARKGPPPAPKK